jgi:hypothetical protein
MLFASTEIMMASGIFKQGFLAHQAWLGPGRNLIFGSTSPVVFAKLLPESIKTTSPVNRKAKPRCNTFLIKVLVALTAWHFCSNIATLMKNLPPVTTNEKFVQYYCWAPSRT